MSTIAHYKVTDVLQDPLCPLKLNVNEPDGDRKKKRFSTNWCELHNKIYLVSVLP